MFKKQFTDVQDAWYLRTLSWIPSENRSSFSIRIFVSLLRAILLSEIQGKSRPTQGKLLYDLGDGQWDIPKLRVLLGKFFPTRGPWRTTKSSMISLASDDARWS